MKKRIESIDIIRGITILLVVLAHSPENFTGHSVLKNFRMPLFFIVSGYLFSFIKYNQNFGLLIQDKIRTLIIPYFSFALLGGLLWSFKHFFIDHDFSLAELLYGIFNANGEFIKGNTPIWFLNCLFFSTIFLYMVLHFTHKLNKLWIQILICLLLGVSGSFISKFVWLPWSIDVALAATLFMYIGFYIKQKDLLVKIPLNITSLILSVSCFSLSSSLNVIIDMNNRIYGNLLLFYLSGISGSFIVFWITEKVIMNIKFISEVLKSIGRDSVIILGFHMILITLLNFTISLFLSDLTFKGTFLIYSFISIIICKIISILVNNFSILLYLFKGKKYTLKKDN